MQLSALTMLFTVVLLFATVQASSPSADKLARARLWRHRDPGGQRKRPLGREDADGRQESGTPVYRDLDETAGTLARSRSPREYRAPVIATTKT